MLRHLALAVVLAATAAGCKKKEEAPPPAAEPAPPPAAEPATPPPAPEPAPAAAAPPAEDPSAEYVKIIGSHTPTKPGDPVVIQLSGFKVTKASFKDPKDLTGGTASLEVDLTSLKSDNETRDQDLKSAKWFDVEKHGVAKVQIKDVKKADAPDSYTAKADVDVHGVKKTLPVEFQVVEQLADGGVRVKGKTAPFSRLDFKVGSPNGEGGNPTSNDVSVELQLVIPKA